MAHSARTASPPVNYHGKGAAAFKFALIDPANDTWLFTCPEAPTAGASGDGAGWAGVGSLCIAISTGKLYINTGSLASPTWTVVGSQT